MADYYVGRAGEGGAAAGEEGTEARVVRLGERGPAVGRFGEGQFHVLPRQELETVLAVDERQAGAAREVPFPAQPQRASKRGAEVYRLDRIDGDRVGVGQGGRRGRRQGSRGAGGQGGRGGRTGFGPRPNPPAPFPGREGGVGLPGIGGCGG